MALINSKKLLLLSQVIKELKVTAKRTGDEVDELTSTVGEHTSSLRSLSDDFAYKLRALENMLRSVSPDPPTPQDLAGLCKRFEEKVFKAHCEGRAAFDFPPHISQQLAKATQRIAAKIAATADLDVLNSVVSGPKSALLRTVAGIDAGIAEASKLGLIGPAEDGEMIPLVITYKLDIISIKMTQKMLPVVITLIMIINPLLSLLLLLMRFERSQTQGNIQMFFTSF